MCLAMKGYCCVSIIRIRLSPRIWPNCRGFRFKNRDNVRSKCDQACSMLSGYVRIAINSQNTIRITIKDIQEGLGTKRKVNDAYSTFGAAASTTFWLEAFATSSDAQQSRNRQQSVNTFIIPSELLEFMAGYCAISSLMLSESIPFASPALTPSLTKLVPYVPLQANQCDVGLNSVLRLHPTLSICTIALSSCWMASITPLISNTGR